MTPQVYEHMSEHGTVLLAGVVGSTAYGLAREESDVDRLGVFAYPTPRLFRLDSPDESVVVHEPSDMAFHEAAKYARLALGANPTVMELLWLDSYEVQHPLGEELVGLRTAFLSARRVRDAYLGYSMQQFKRLERRADGSFDSDTKNRSRKHARHMARLMNQGYLLYTTGELVVKVDNPDWYHEFSEADERTWLTWFDRAQYRFDNAETVLPVNPDRDAVEDWLMRVRFEFLPH